MSCSASRCNFLGPTVGSLSVLAAGLYITLEFRCHVRFLPLRVLHATVGQLQHSKAPVLGSVSARAQPKHVFCRRRKAKTQTARRCFGRSGTSHRTPCSAARRESAQCPDRVRVDFDSGAWCLRLSESAAMSLEQEDGPSRTVGQG